MSKEAEASWDRWIKAANREKGKRIRKKKEVIKTNAEEKTNTIPDGYYESDEYKKFCEERTKKYN